MLYGNKTKIATPITYITGASEVQTKENYVIKLELDELSMSKEITWNCM